MKRAADPIVDLHSFSFVQESSYDKVRGFVRKFISPTSVRDDTMELDLPTLHETLVTRKSPYIEPCISGITRDPIAIHGNIPFDEMPLQKIPYTVVNSLYTYTLYDKYTHVQLPFPNEQLVKAYPELGWQYPPKHFGKISFRTIEPRSCVTFYVSGILTITGISNDHTPDEICDNFIMKRMLIPFGMHNVALKDKKCCNIVGRFKTPFTLGLNVIHKATLSLSRYDPVIFDAVMFRNISKSRNEKKCTILLFRPNKGICVGANNIQTMVSTIQEILKVVYPYRCEIEANRKLEEKHLREFKKHRESIVATLSNK